MAQRRSVIITHGAGSWVFTDTRCNINSNAGELPNADPPEEVVRHPDFFFDNTLVAIQVEDTLFNVHKYQLLKSETFSDMFKVPKAEDGDPEEGSSPEHPIIMEGVKAEDVDRMSSSKSFMPAISRHTNQSLKPLSSFQLFGCLTCGTSPTFAPFFCPSPKST
ncbi:hypothetical protein RSAG8_10019, partial [Rhizoctonia solani AG-8 WAC10335]